MTTRPRLAVPLVPALVAALAGAAHAQSIPTPEDHLGRPAGTDFELADWEQVSSYHRRLAAASPRVAVDVVGTTTEGREFLRTVVTSEQNLAWLDAIRADAARVADPRGLTAEERRALLERAKVVVCVSLQMHSTETAGTEFGMEFVHRLATSEEEPWRTIRDRVVVVVFPCTNPDGLDEVVSWYRRTVGTPYEGTGMLRLYQKYAGHDNNRDWFMLSQPETRIVTEQLYSVWRPQVYWDVHQQGRTRERMFVPPYRDPLNPNLDPAIIAGIDALGSRALLDLTRAGHAGVSTGVTYDMWWNGGNRNVPVRHNIIGLLTEAASVNVASPVFFAKEDLAAPRGIDGGYVPSNRFPMPWPGGWWRLRDIIDYELAFGESLLASLAREPRTWLENAIAAADRAIAAAAHDAPVAWVLPSDQADRGAVRRLADALLRGGVELRVAGAPFEADDRTWPAGSIVVDRAQPYGAHVKDLFEVQRYPDGDPPYDVAGWTLPLLLGVHRVEVIQPFEVEATGVADAAAAVAGFPVADVPDGGRSARDSDTWRDVFRRLAASETLTFSTGGTDPGAWYPGLRDEKLGTSRTVSPPRIGLYAPWSGHMREGWMRWVFDAFEVPYVRVRNEMLRAGALDDLLDVLVLPGVSSGHLGEGRESGSVFEPYARGLDPEGAVAIEEFVRRGGTVVAAGASCRFVVDLLDLPLVDVTRGKDAGDFSCPGSVLRGVPSRSPYTAGLPASVPLFFSRSAAFATKKDADDARIDVLLRYAPTRTLLSGWIRAPDRIAGEAAWLRARHGEGAVHLFGFHPQYRSWSQGTFQLLFRAMLLR